jgi:hypothetical protein
MRLVAAVRAYVAHDDPATAAANFVALVVGWNGPFYPLFVVALVDRGVIALSLLTMVATPFFLAIPWLSRLSSTGARAALPIVGTLHTLWCTKLLGPGTAVGLFLFPCIALAGLLARREERRLLLVVAGVPLVATLLPERAFGPPLMPLTAAQTAHLAGLNIGSVATLTFLLSLLFADLLRRSAAK